MQVSIETFGINWYLVIAQIINFIVVFYILKRFIYKPVFTVLTKRKEMIKKGLDDTKKSEALLEDATQQRQDIIKKSKDQAKRIVDDAQKEAQVILETARAKAKKQADVMIQEGHDTIAREARMAEERLEKHIGVLVKDIITKSLKDVLTPSEQKDILNRTMKVVEQRQR